MKYSLHIHIPDCVRGERCEICFAVCTVKFLNFGTLKNFAVIYLKLKQRGQTLGYFVKNMQMEKQTVKTQTRPEILQTGFFIIRRQCTVTGDLDQEGNRFYYKVNHLGWEHLSPVPVGLRGCGSGIATGVP